MNSLKFTAKIWRYVSDNFRLSTSSNYYIILRDEMNDKLSICIKKLQDLGVYQLIVDGPDGRLLTSPEKPRRVLVHSIGKSVFTIGLYFAMQDGIVNLNDSIYEYLEEPIERSNLSDEQKNRLKKICYRHLLSMTMGQKQDFLTGEQRPYIEENDWVRLCMKIPIIHEPGEIFLYSDMCMYLAGKIVQNRTGQNLSAYLYPRLFKPLAISMPTWEIDPNGDCITCGGLLMAAPEVHKFGLLIADGGYFNGIQIVPTEWIRDITTARTIVDADTKTGYGYGFWKRKEYPYMFGYGGKYCLTDPKHKSVVTAFSDDPDTSGEVLNQLVLLMDFLCHN